MARRVLSGPRRALVGRRAVFLVLWIAAATLPWGLPWGAFLGWWPKLFLPVALVGGFVLAPLPLQWLALRRLVSWSRLWVAATLSAVFFVYCVATLDALASFLPDLLPLGLLLFPILLACAQWIALAVKVQWAYCWPILLLFNACMRFAILMFLIEHRALGVALLSLVAAAEAILLLVLIEHPRRPERTASPSAASGPVPEPRSPATPAQAPPMDASTPESRPREPSRTLSREKAIPVPDGAHTVLDEPSREVTQDDDGTVVFARVSLYLFLATFALPFVTVPAPNRRSDDLLLIVLVLITCGCLGLLSFVLGTLSLLGSRRALLWILPGVLLLILTSM
jgi:hypothetical protein